ncbi:GntR family transcriptional regulator [Bifidobacterium sp. DSM 109958]|uniref:GntR family transcriptional regulator n=2 Tax=Bifidobacterium moraviense TaxID=2675323 RepID=A0A7Y0I034_9BIFI|nr:FadR/GntR family transcriptional regulator [Bifidobacterium sp. DSM 109958]NMN01043.1 GntR family transcriptional regulator [Bifidobacterium sp. DSM 109958]
MTTAAKTTESAGRPATVFLKAGKGKASEVAVVLERRIISGEYRPGMRLPSERDLAASFAVSRNTVRDALSLLEKRQLIRIRWGAGTVVLGPEEAVLRMTSALEQSQHELDNVTELRDLLEPEITALAARRATDADLIALNDIIERSNPRMQPRESLKLDMAFHMALARSTDNALIVTILDFANDATERVRLSSHRTLDRREISLAGHRRIFEMVRAHDVDGAREAMRRHLDEVAAISDAPDVSAAADPFDASAELGSITETTTE